MVVAVMRVARVLVVTLVLVTAIMRGTVAVVMSVMVVPVLMAVAAGVRAVRGVLRDFLQQAIDVAPETAEAGRFLARALVHVEAAVNLRLQAVAPVLRIRKGPDELHALVGIVDLHLVAHPAQRVRDQRGEPGLACRAVAVAQDEIGARLAGSLLGEAPAQGGHRMAVDVPHRAEVVARRVERVLYRALVRLVVAHDALLHLVDRKLARVDRLARVEDAPYEPDAELRLAAGDGRAPAPRGPRG